MASRLALQRYQNSLPSTGDFVQGQGPSTLQRSSVGVLDSEAAFNPIGTTIAPAAHTAPWAQPVAVWFVLLVLLLVAKYAAERGGHGEEFSTIRIGFWNIAVTYLMVLIAGTVAKWFAGYWRIPGVSTLVLAGP